MQCHSERLCLEESPGNCLYAERSEASPPKRVKARDPSHLLWRIRDDIEIPRRPIGLARNDSGATEEHRRPMMHHCFTNKGQLHGEASMPAFIGPYGARKKEERGRGLFERSEFRSPVGERSERQEYPITSGRPFLVTSLRRERSYRTMSF